MKKKWMIPLLVCVLALLPLAALAEGGENASSAELQLDMKVQYMPAIKPIQGTGLVTMESKLDNALGLFTTEGRELIPYGIAAVSKLKYDFLSVSRDKDTLNARAIYKTDGTQVSDYVYGSVTAYDDRWVAGFVLEKAEGKNNDVTVNKVKYQIVRWDLYFVSGEGISLIASLDRQQYAEAKPHGDYISIKNREGAVTAYDRNFNPVELELKTVSTPYYRVDNFDIVNKITNETIASGYVSVQESPQPTRLLLTAGVTRMNGTEAHAILDENGNVLLPADYTVVSVTDPYVVVADENGLQGLYSLAENRLLAPCEFTAVNAYAASLDPYVNNGYISVEKDGMMGYVDARACAVSCQPAYNSRITKVYGCSTVFDGEKGYVLVAGDGVRTELYDYEEVAAGRGDGYLLVAKKNGFYGVIDWHGAEKLPFIHKNAITLTDDSRALIRTSTGLELDAIIAR